ncbi:MAG: HAD family hydrolase [Proteobacteria bacterium]|nr:HAD family hydrolase [Pseudomonadota bacterium]
MTAPAKPLKAPLAVLFDLDGTLADRAAALARYCRLFVGDFGEALGPEVDAVQVEGAILAVDDGGALPRRDLAVVLASALPWRAPVSSETLLRHWNERFGAVATPFPDVCGVIDALEARAIGLGLVSNGGAAMQWSKVQALGLAPRLGAVVISEEVGVAKPDPAIFHLALDRLGVAAADAWFVGDNPDADVRGAEAAGLTAFWVATGMSWDGEAPPRRCLTRLGDLMAHLA